MKEKKQEKSKKPISHEMLLRRNPIPFGDVRKYYYAGMIGTVALLALCFHISVVVIAIRTDTCVQIPNGIIFILLLCAVLSIIGHYSRTIIGYVLSAGMCLGIVLVMQFYGGGITLQSNLPEYGEVFRDAIKSTDFWFLLVKIFAVLHFLISVVVIISTIKVTEAPPLKGMNAIVTSIRDWFYKNNNSHMPGQRATDYWCVTVCVLCWMIMAAQSPTDTGKYDYWAMGMILLGAVAVALKKTYLGAGAFFAGFLVQCTMYQWRFGVVPAIVSSYLGLWVALFFLLMETIRIRKSGQREVKDWSLEFGTRHRVLILVNKENKGCPDWYNCARKILLIMPVLLFVLLTPVHEFLASFSGSYMTYQKDNLPLLFFLPIGIFLGLFSDSLIGYICAVGFGLWLEDSLRNASPYKKGEFFRFDSISQHGAVGESASYVMNILVNLIILLSILTVFVTFILLVIRAREVYRETE